MSFTHANARYDAIIIGAGAAGLSAALGLLKASSEKQRKPRLLVVSKLPSLRSHTGSAEGGIAASLGNEGEDHWQWHYYDTVKGSDWLADQDAVALMTRHAASTVIALEREGAVFSRTPEGLIAQRQFGGHTADHGKQAVKRAAYAADRIGHQILTTLWQQCVREQVTFAEECYVSDLVLDETQQAVSGIVMYDLRTGSLNAVAADAVVLATGGAGRLFHTTSNSWDLTGDGMGLSLQASLQLEDMEFMQFHPTGLGHTGILLSEAARAEGGVLRNAHGDAFMHSYAPAAGDLAARDIVSRAIMQEIDEGRGVVDPSYAYEGELQTDCVWLDLTQIPEERLHQALPQVLHTIQTYAALDPHTQLVPVRPTAHYTMGGIPVDLHGGVYRWDARTQSRKAITGLYAAGECSCVSVHGANRLGGNSLLDACFFGERAGFAIARAFQGSPELGKSESEHEHDPETALPETLQQALAQRQQQLHELLNSNASHSSDTRNNASVSHAQETLNTQVAQDSSAPSSSSTPSSTPSNAYEYARQLGLIMDAAMAVRCDAATLTHALESVQQLRTALPLLHAHHSSTLFNQELPALWQAQRLTDVALAMLRAALHRSESRGSLYRRDFPQRDDEHFLAHTMIDQRGTLTMQPVHLVDIEPQQRAY